MISYLLLLLFTTNFSFFTEQIIFDAKQIKVKNDMVFVVYQNYANLNNTLLIYDNHLQLIDSSSIIFKNINEIHDTIVFLNFNDLANLSSEELHQNVKNKIGGYKINFVHESKNKLLMTGTIIDSFNIRTPSEIKIYVRDISTNISDKIEYFFPNDTMSIERADTLFKNQRSISMTINDFDISNIYYGCLWFSETEHTGLTIQEPIFFKTKEMYNAFLSKLYLALKLEYE